MQLVFNDAPNALRYMALAFWPSPGLQPALPRIEARWAGWRAAPADIADFNALCGLPASGDELPALLPHAAAFRLQMALLTHPRFPVPIWRVLQVRNRLRQWRPVPAQSELDFHCHLAAHRVLDKGAEFDLRTRVERHGEPVAESLNTFYVRGRFAGMAQAGAPESPSTGDTPVAAWPMPGGGGLRFARLTGDYNGIHLWNAYARLFGFPKAFFHPLRVVAQALGHARVLPACPWGLDVWLKGPVLHDSQVELRERDDPRGTVLALFAAHDARPAIVAQVLQGREAAGDL
jgi:hypothetical protein